MAVHLMLPPSSGNQYNPITVNGRTYSCAIGSVCTVPNDGDAAEMQANGWTMMLGTTGAGPSSARPTNPKQGQSLR